VDRLEKRGLAERRADVDDRRVKRVVLTARGAAIRAQIDEAFHRPPPSLAALSHHELDGLIAVLGRVT
jgi:DNA-binding MarR family transcriptional regulator